MNQKERILLSLEYKPVDKIPIDFGSTVVTGMHVSVVEELREYYGLEKKPVKVIDPYQMLGEIDDTMRRLLRLDVVGIHPPKNMFGYSTALRSATQGRGTFTMQFSHFDQG